VKDIHELAGLTLSWGARVMSGASGRWVDCEPSSRQRVYFANHSSHLDILILWASLPADVRRMTRPVAARDYWWRNAVRRYLVTRVFNAIMIERREHGGGFRGAYEAIEATLQGMGDHYSIIIFPEGTRGSGEKIGEFKGGIYSIAEAKPGVEFVPVYIENVSRILPKGELLLVPLLSSITFGKPLTLGKDERKREFLGRARQAVVDLQEA